MPTFSLVAIAKYGFTLFVVGLLTVTLISYVGDFMAIIGELLSKISSSTSTVNGLNLGWFANAIGLVDFMNSLMASLYVAGAFFVSSLVSILGLKFVIKLYTSFTRI